MTSPHAAQCEAEASVANEASAITLKFPHVHQSVARAAVDDAKAALSDGAVVPEASSLSKMK